MYRYIIHHAMGRPIYADAADAVLAPRGWYTDIQKPELLHMYVFHTSRPNWPPLFGLGFGDGRDRYRRHSIGLEIVS